MVTLIRSLQVFSDGTLQVQTTQTVPDPDLLYLRVPHDMERVSFDDPQDLTYIPNSDMPTAKGHIRKVVRERNQAMPEVYRLNPLHSIPLTATLQKLWYGINPDLTVNSWWTLMKHDAAFTNNKSGWKDGDPRANYVAGTNLDKEPPAYDQPRVTGGHIFRGRRDGDRAILETIRVDKGNLPTPEQLLNMPWLWFWATSISPSGRIQYFNRMGKDGTYKRVRVPLFTRQEVWLPIKELHSIGPNDYILPDTIVHR